MLSVIIATYRRYEMLKKAIDSVLAQTYQNIEIIVIDDCSMDDTAKISDLSPKITYYCNSKNSGPSHSRRRGLLYSHGDYIIFLDDDDYYTDTSFFEKAVDVLNNEHDCIFVAANALVSYEDEGKLIEDRLNTIGRLNTATYLEGFPFNYKKPHSTFTSVFRKSALLKAGVADMNMLNDMPLYMKCLTLPGTVHFLEDSIGIYRVHSNNISKSMTWDFIRSNMEDKYAVKQSIENNKLFSDTTLWWFKQIEITIGYFIYGSHPSIAEFKNAKKWCLKHSDDKEEVFALFRKYQKYLIDYRICKFKSKIKKILSMR